MGSKRNVWQALGRKPHKLGRQTNKQTIDDCISLKVLHVFVCWRFGSFSVLQLFVCGCFGSTAVLQLFVGVLILLQYYSSLFKVVLFYFISILFVCGRFGSTSFLPLFVCGRLGSSSFSLSRFSFTQGADQKPAHIRWPFETKDLVSFCFRKLKPDE